MSKKDKNTHQIKNAIYYHKYMPGQGVAREAYKSPIHEKLKLDMQA